MSKVVRVRVKGVIGGLSALAKNLGGIPKEAEAQFARAVQAAAFQAVYSEVAPKAAGAAPVDSGAFQAGLSGQWGAFTSSKRKAARYSNPVFDLTPYGDDITVEYGSDPFEETSGGSEHFYGKYVKFNMGQYRPMINQAVTGAVKSAAEAFLVQLFERALDRSFVRTRTGRGYGAEKLASLPRSRQLKIFRQRRYILKKYGSAA
jgi:hypothetical protein